MDVLLQTFKAIAPYLSNPLVLIGFVLLLFFGLHRTLLKAGIIPPLSARTGGKVVQILLRYGFVIALVAIVLGFGLQFFQTYSQSTRTPESAVPDDDKVPLSGADVTVEASGGGTATLQTGSGTVIIHKGEP